jgi:hypothetical protein
MLAQGQPCLLDTKLLKYTPLSLQAGAQGIVTARFTVGEDGKAIGDTYEAKQLMLVQSVRRAVNETPFPVACVGNYAMTVEFKIREEVSFDLNQAVEIRDPSSYIVAVNTQHAIVDSVELRPESRSRRLLRKVFRR